MEVKYKTINNQGEYSCGDIDITTDEWYELLCDKKAIPYIEPLISFMREPEHKGTCSAMSQKYDKITNFSKWVLKRVQKKLKRLSIINTEEKDTFWAITMQKGKDTKNGFVWQLRDELTTALRRYLMRNLINKFCNGIPFKEYGETYKWELLDKTDGASALDIVKNLKEQNVIDNKRVDGILKILWETKEIELTNIINHLLDETVALDARIDQFKTEMRSICPSSFDVCANDERTAAAILTCRYPEKYTFYIDKVYKSLWQYFGFEHQKPGRKYSHFLDIINMFTQKYGEDIQKHIEADIAKYSNKPLNLSVQTFFWCMQEYMKDKYNNMKESQIKIKSRYNNIVELLKQHKNIILQGAPGTGKTYEVPEIAVRLCNPDFDFTNYSREELMSRYNQLKQEKRIVFTTFHQSMDYEDWIEGLKPVVESNQVTYKIEDGIFMHLCNEAERNETDAKPYIIVIDEMNRGNVSKIFGELITLLEADKRKEKKDAENVVLPYSKKSFTIPDNVFIIATMNTADRSLGNLDYAVRRRFAFIPCKPYSLEGIVEGFNVELFKQVSSLFISNYDEYKESGWKQSFALKSADTLSEEYRPEDVWIGHSYFIMEDEDGEDITNNRLLYEIIPLLEEYVRDGVLTENAQETIEDLRKKALE